MKLHRVYVLKKYLISIESDDSLRLINFFNQDTFSNYKNEFIKFGIKGSDLPINTYFNLAVASQKKALSPGELGCTLSHLGALEDFIASEADYALIFEDDVIETRYLNLNQFEEQMKGLKLKPCFFLSLGGIQLSVSNGVRGKIEINQIFGKNILKLHPLSFSSLCYTYAYIVDRSMAKVLCEYHEIPHVCDHWGEIYQLNSNVNFYATFLFDHPEVNQNQTIMSSIEDERKLMSEKNKVKKSMNTKFKNSIVKRWLNLFYEKYRE